jgi:hypothetical protein
MKGVPEIPGASVIMLFYAALISVWRLEKKMGH